MTTRLGSQGPIVSRVGLGCMAMSGVYGPADEAESIATIHAALDAGINLIDTGDFYGMGHNEILIGRALAGRDRDQALISVKFGAQRGPDGSWLGYDARPAAVKTALAYSLQRLRTDHVDVYRPARLDPQVPIEETIGAITAYGVLSRGLIGGHWSPDRRLQGDSRERFPRFQGENAQRNLALVEQLRVLAEAQDASVAQLAIAWVLSRGEDIVPLVGARTRERWQEAVAAQELERRLTAADLKQIEQAIPPRAALGERYAAAQMVSLDSER